MRKSGLILPLLVISLAIAQTPSELIGPLITENPMLIISIIVGAVTYIGISRIYSLQEWAPHLAFVVAFALFLFTTFVEPVQLQFQAAYSPINAGVVSSIGFDLLPLLAIAAVLIIVALFFSRFTPGAKGVGYGGMSWRMIAFIVGIIMVIISSIIGSFINSPVITGPIIAVGGLLILFAVLGSLMHTAASVTGRGSPRGSPDRRDESWFSRNNPFKGRFAIWVCVVYGDPSNTDHQNWASDPQDEGNRKNLLTLPRVKDANIRARRLHGIIPHALRGFRRAWKWITARRTDDNGMLRMSIEAGKEYDVHAWGGKIKSATGVWGEIDPDPNKPNFRHIYTIDSDTPRPQIVIPINMKVSGAGPSTEKGRLIQQLERIETYCNNLLNQPAGAVNIPYYRRNEIQAISNHIAGAKATMAAIGTSYSNSDPNANQRDGTYMQMIWDRIRELLDGLDGMYPAGHGLRTGQLNGMINRRNWNAWMGTALNADPAPANDIINRFEQIANDFDPLMNNILPSYWNPAYAAYPQPYRDLMRLLGAYS